MKTMDPKKKERLEAAGWRVGDAADFLGLSPEEELVVELRLKLRQSIRDLRKEQGLTQEELAKRLGSTQPRISAMESGELDSDARHVDSRAACARSVCPKPGRDGWGVGQWRRRRGAC